MKTVLAIVAMMAAMPAHAAPADPSQSPTPFGAAVPVEADQLDAITGQADLAQVVNANNNGNVTNSQVSGNSVTGTINFDGQSFQNANGLTVLSANTGNNVVFNASLNVNVSISR